MEGQAKESNLLIRELLLKSVPDHWERAFVEIYVATYEMSIKFEYRYIDINMELKSFNVNRDIEDKLFECLIQWCSECLEHKGKRWNRIHADLTMNFFNIYSYWDQWYYDDLYPSG